MWVKISVVLALLFVFCLPISAQNSGADEAEKEFLDMTEAIPHDVARLLPKSIFEGSTQAGEGLDTTLDADFWLDVVWNELSGGMESVRPLLLSVLGMLIVSAILSSFRDAFRSEALSNAVSLAVSVVMVSLLVKNAALHIEAVTVYFERLYDFCLAMLPLMGALLAMGGSGMAAVAAHGGFLTVLGVLESFVGQSFRGIAGISLALTAANSVSLKFRLSSLARAIRRVFAVFFSIVTAALGFIVSIKIGLAAAGDSMAMRGARLFASNAIPIVGGAVGDSLRTLVTAISYIKSVSGVLGIVVILLLVLPVFLRVWMFRACLVLLSGMAEILGCEKERELLSGVVSVYGYMLAVLAVTAVIFIIMVTLFAKIAPAFGG